MALPSVDSHWSPAPCDCTHHFVKHAPTTVTRGASVAIDFHLQVWAVASLHQVMTPVLTAIIDAARASASIHSVLSQGLHNSVVLRC
jgi:hypothetical protein